MTPQAHTAQDQPVSDQPTAETPTPETDSERKRIPMIGKKYGFLTVVSEAPKSITPSGQTQLRYNCLCDCGNKTISIGGDLRSGRSKSCGCVRRKDQTPSDASSLEIQLDAARAELERAKDKYTEEERLRWQNVHADFVKTREDNARLRADLAAAREESRIAQELLDESTDSRMDLARQIGCKECDTVSLFYHFDALRKELETATARAVEAERERDEMHAHLGEMLDEIRTTKRQNYWPSQLLCAECGCNVSDSEPHRPACKIGLAIAAWDAIDAARVATLPGDGEGN